MVFLEYAVATLHKVADNPKRVFIYRAGPDCFLSRLLRATPNERGSRAFLSVSGDCLQPGPAEPRASAEALDLTVYSRRHAQRPRHQLGQHPGKRCAMAGYHACSLATRMTSFPKLRPSSRPMNAAGAFSRPSTISSRYRNLPLAIQSLASS